MQLLGIHRSALFYEPVPETPENLELMQLIDAKYLKHPFYGSRRMLAFSARQATASTVREFSD
jgi:putative transposase